MAVTFEPAERMEPWESTRHADIMGSCVECIETEEISIVPGIHITSSITKKAY